MMALGGAAAQASAIYTKTGDDGTTGRLFGGRVPKDDLLVEASRDVDEAVAVLGWRAGRSRTLPWARWSCACSASCSWTLRI